jgi:hypothetical protein
MEAHPLTPLSRIDHFEARNQALLAIWSPR